MSTGGAVRLVGYTADELLGMTPVHLNPYSSEHEYRELVTDLLADPELTVRREARLLRRDGNEVPVEKTYQAAPIARDGSRWVVAVARDVTARLQAEEDLRQSQDALRQAEQVVALAAERDRIARDLQDTVVQRLFGVGLGLQDSAGGPAGRVRERIDTAIDEIDVAIRELRSAIFSLQTSRTLPDNLRSRLLSVASGSSRASGVQVRLQFDGPIDALDDRIAAHLVPILREALANVTRHAHAHDVRVVVSSTDGVVRLTVVDDGDGIHGELVWGHGLESMRRRAEELGGTSTFGPGPETGCQFEWSVPASPVD
jgi:PAS domain S-box-containing protein